MSLDELSNTNVGMGLSIERDIMWTSGISLQECLDIEKNKQTL